MSGKPTDEAARELRARQVQGREPGEAAASAPRAAQPAAAGEAAALAGREASGVNAAVRANEAAASTPRE
ncbi:hypothetical protein, partial [Burkholderia gladioli]|uniref:hypothetical protein n=1 Tax=Burkholderia gladioli TaxID=28095 RepID=UPI003F562539|nr:hypothetical protein [Burkholderia gladioli]